MPENEGLPYRYNIEASSLEQVDLSNANSILEKAKAEPSKTALDFSLHIKISSAPRPRLTQEDIQALRQLRNVDIGKMLDR